MSTVSEKIDFIKRSFGICNIDRAGLNVAVKCPGCNSNDDKKKLSINLDTWQAHCWVCGLKAKTIFSILKKFNDYRNAEIFSNKFLGRDYHHNEHTQDADIEEDLLLPEKFIFLAANSKSKDPDVKACLKYLRSRDISEKDLWYYKMGTTKVGRYARRIIIPSFDTSGELNFFVARTIDKKNSYKYINAPVDKKSIIFNEYAINWSRELTIVEGPFDLMRCNQNATCLLGSNLTESMRLFERIVSNKTPVLLCLDADMENKAQKIAQKLASFDCNVRILDLGLSEDVGSMSKDDFIYARKNAHTWTQDESLKHRISKINSGSSLMNY
jgi:hypothetical protein